MYNIQRVTFNIKYIITKYNNIIIKIIIIVVMMMMIIIILTIKYTK